MCETWRKNCKKRLKCINFWFVHANLKILCKVRNLLRACTIVTPWLLETLSTESTESIDSRVNFTKRTSLRPFYPLKACSLNTHKVYWNVRFLKFTLQKLQKAQKVQNYSTESTESTECTESTKSTESMESTKCTESTESTNVQKVQKNRRYRST